MTQQNSDPNDVRDESITETTRRGALAALGLGGLATLTSSGASAQLGGGPEADAMSEYRVPTYRVPESDLDSPGVVGRRVEITSGGASYSAGDQLVDTGSSWERISAGYDSVSTEKLGIGAGFETVEPSEGCAGIQDKIDSMDAGIIRLTTGDYIGDLAYQEGVNVNVNKPIILWGDGWDATRIKFADGAADGTGDGNRMVNLTHPFAGLVNLQVDGNRRNQSTSISEAYDGYNIAIGRGGSNSATDASGSRVWGVYSRDGMGDGIECLSDNVLVSHYLAKDNYEQNFHVRDSKGVTLSNFYFEDERDGSHIHTYSFGNLEDVTIANGTMVGGDFAGIKVFANADIDGFDVENVIIDGPSTAGVSFNSSGAIRNVDMDVMIKNAGTQGILNVGSGDRENFDIEATIDNPADNGVEVGGAGTARNLTFDVDVDSAGGHGAVVKHGQDISFPDASIYRPQKRGFNIISTQGSIKDLQLPNVTVRSPNRAGSGFEAIYLNGSNPMDGVDISDPLIEHDSGLANPMPIGIKVTSGAGYDRVDITGHEILGAATDIDSDQTLRQVKNAKGGFIQYANVGGGTETAVGGSSPAARISNATNGNITSSQGDRLVPWVYSTGSLATAYALGEPYLEWNTSGYHDLVVPWATDPGSGNDVSFKWAVEKHAF